MRDALGAVESVLVLGGTSDIAEAVVSKLAEGRARRAVLAGREPERLERSAERLRAAGVGELALERWDAADVGSQREFADRVFDAHGDIDLALVAAGVLGPEDEAQRDGATAARILQVNFTGLAAAMTEIARRMREQGHGTIVVLSSVAGERARRSNYVYGSSKAGLDAFAQGMADSLAGTGVQVLVVRPGFVHTSMTEGMDAPPLSTDAGAVAERVVTGLRRGSHTVWAPPAMRWVMLVLRLLPRPIFRRLPF